MPPSKHFEALHGTLTIFSEIPRAGTALAFPTTRSSLTWAGCCRS